MPSYDCVVIGAGFAGAVCARELAERAGLRVLLLEQRPHIAGNAYDRYDDAGILIHQYGPHIFHTESQRVFDYLSRFTRWRSYEHRVLASVGERYLPVPFNLRSLRLAFGESEGARLGAKLLATYGPEKKIGILQLREEKDPDLARVADYIYDNIFVRYTQKQWGSRPEEIDPATTARVPIFLSEDDRYFQDRFQGLPEDGYTALFRNMLDHPNITLRCSSPASTRLRFSEGRILLDGAPFAGKLIYTGAVDELFDCCFSPLPYRTLDFAFQTLNMPRFQPAATVNYTVSEDFTRITEFTQLTGQHSAQTSIMREYARAYERDRGDLPYYAILSPHNRALYERYRALTAQYENVYLLGRLAEYQYYNMDAITEKALALCDRLTSK